ncbi:Transcriptional repressor TUP1 [Gossypium arboreum]|uniref:Transcriptional repressor TUP1 n=1 Tax=Gossypium arboreum TaxID=29729 RepID=A0A0B0MU93_GOSAR|nr:Transcriptional repressor TUP1 [Gossypium arboreum]
MVVAEDAVWNFYISSHKLARQLRHHVEDVANAKNLKEGNRYHGCEDDVSLDQMDFSTTQSQLSKPNKDGSTFSKKKKKDY